MVFPFCWVACLDDDIIKMPGKHTVGLQSEMWQLHVTWGGQLLSLIHFSFPTLAYRIPLTRIKSMRENLREKDELKDYLEKHPYNLAYKFVESVDPDTGVYYESMRNYLDVSAVGRMAPQSTP